MLPACRVRSLDRVGPLVILPALGSSISASSRIVIRSLYRVAMVGVYFSGAAAPTCLYTVPKLTPKRRATSLACRRRGRVLAPPSIPPACVCG